MKKLIVISIFLPLLVPSLALADSTYTCSNSALAPITVSDPSGADGSKVSSYVSSCSNAGGTVNGASAQQLQAQATANAPCQTIPSGDLGQVTYVGNCGSLNNNGNNITTSGPTGVTGLPNTSAPSTPSTPSAGATTNANGSNLGYVPLEPIPGITPTNIVDPRQLPTIINNIFTVLITAGALLAVLMLTIGGVQYMISGGPAQKNEGIRHATAALWGLLLLSGIWLILHTINPYLLQFNLNPCPAGASGCSIATSASNSTQGGTNTNTAACGADFVNGCPANYSCASTIVEGGGQGLGCVPSGSANAACNSSGGQWNVSITGSYCYLSQYSSQSTCTAAGGTWTSNWIQSNYCYK